MGTYVPNTKAEQQKMLESCGFHSFDEMYACIPEELRLKKPLELPEGKSELESFTTATENAGKSYAGLVTDWMGLDSMLTCFSGHGIVSGYTDSPEKRNAEELVPPYYERAGRNGFILPSGRILEEILWDFSSWQPEKILINLGTNDLSWCADREPRKDLFRKDLLLHPQSLYL